MDLDPGDSKKSRMGMVKRFSVGRISNISIPPPPPPPPPLQSPPQSPYAYPHAYPQNSLLRVRKARRGYSLPSLSQASPSSTSTGGGDPYHHQHESSPYNVNMNMNMNMNVNVSESMDISGLTPPDLVVCGGSVSCGSGSGCGTSVNTNGSSSSSGSSSGSGSADADIYEVEEQRHKNGPGSASSSDAGTHTRQKLKTMVLVLSMLMNLCLIVIVGMYYSPSIAEPVALKLKVGHKPGGRDQDIGYGEDISLLLSEIRALDDAATINANTHPVLNSEEESALPSAESIVEEGEEDL